MKIVAIAMVRNEADIVELFVRHHLQIVDHMIVAEHLSRDETPTILGDLREQGAALEVVSESRPGYNQSAVLTSLLRQAARTLEADWVVPLDCDEFLCCDHSLDVRAELEKLASDRPHRIPWRTYVPTSSDLEAEPHLFGRIRHRLRMERRPEWKIVVPGSIARRDEFSLAPGNHKLLKRGWPWPSEIRGEVVDHLHLAHFPVRSTDQIIAKCLSGWPALLASSDWADIPRSHWQSLFERLKNGCELQAAELTDLAIYYDRRPRDGPFAAELIEDPVRSPQGEISLRYSGKLRAEPLAILADTAERLAIEVEALRRTRGMRRGARCLAPILGRGRSDG